jgi:hypothetical protein
MLLVFTTCRQACAAWRQEERTGGRTVSERRRRRGDVPGMMAVLTQWLPSGQPWRAALLLGAPNPPGMSDGA